uniref:Uncharacterized protein n=1 Tax=Alexandrium monilatum TaxID=311494 RepID=A0A7S4UHY9_9DINO
MEAPARAPRPRELRKTEPTWFSGALLAAPAAPTRERLQPMSALASRLGSHTTVLGGPQRHVLPSSNESHRAAERPRRETALAQNQRSQECSSPASAQRLGGLPPPWPCTSTPP